MRIMAFSDVHSGRDVNFPNVVHEKYINTFGSLFSAIFKKLKKEFKNSDIIINMGDVIADKDRREDIETYKEFINLFREIKEPVIHVIGNHEAKHIPRTKLAKFIKQKDTYYSKNIDGFHFIVLDGRWDGYPYFLPEKQIEWLKKDLNKNQLPTIICIHYPVDEQNIGDNPYFTEHRKINFFIDKKSKVRSIFEQSKNVLLVIQGHSHFPSKQEINDIVYLTIPSLTENNGKGKPSNKYTEIDINDKTHKIKTKIRKLSN